MAAASSEPGSVSCDGATPTAIGPGRIVLVVGPSGAGKDAVIRAAREHCVRDSRVVFPARVVTRPPNSAEDHDTLSNAAFESEAGRGAFALRWEAHGLLYGIPRSIDDDARQGRTVVFNASRSAVGTARNRYRHVSVVLVDATPELRTARLAARGREAAGDIAARVNRSVSGFSAADVDLVIDNSGTVADAVRTLVDWLQATRD